MKRRSRITSGQELSCRRRIDFDKYETKYLRRDIEKRTGREKARIPSLQVLAAAAVLKRMTFSERRAKIDELSRKQHVCTVPFLNLSDKISASAKEFNLFLEKLSEEFPDLVNNVTIERVIEENKKSVTLSGSIIDSEFILDLTGEMSRINQLWDWLVINKYDHFFSKIYAKRGDLFVMVTYLNQGLEMRDFIRRNSVIPGNLKKLNIVKIIRFY